MRTSSTDLAGSRPGVDGRVFVLGDSHIHAIKDALEARAGDTAVPIEARRLLKMKPVTEQPDKKLGILDSALKRFRRSPSAREVAVLGDISADEALGIVRSLGPNDVLVSVIGGNQHAVFSTIQHPQPFDFITPEGGPPAKGAEMVPFRALYDYFRDSLRKGDGETIDTLRRSTTARMVHLLAPPPKRKNAWIEHYHDTFFASEGITRLGVSSPDLRIKFWRLQNRAIEEICADLGIEVMGPPPDGCDEDGFLARDCYAGDATHANVKYGELVLRQLETYVTGRAVKAEAAA